MKRYISAFTVAAIICFFTMPIFAADSFITYTLDDLKMQIDIPSELNVITKDYVSDEQKIVDMGVDILLVQASEAYLAAFTDDLNCEIDVTRISDADTKSLWNLNEFDDSEIFDANLIKELYAKEGMIANFDKIYRTGTAAYQVINLENTQDGRSDYGIQYYTVMNGIGISVNIWSFVGPVTSEQAALHKTIVDSIVFTEILENPNPIGSKLRLSGINGYTALYVALSIMISAVIYQVSRKMRIKNALAVCLVNDWEFAGEVFKYKGKSYDKEIYIQNHIIRLQLLKDKNKQLPKLLSECVKKTDSNDAMAVLYQLEAEAITRILSNNESEISGEIK
jgi:hypothetical protein